MAIETIGLYPITIDVYKKHKESTVYANDNDMNGRGLLINLVKNNASFDSTGITLKIGFRNAVGEERLYDCDIVDVLTGQYKVFYPTEMLVGNGGRVVKLEIKAYESTGALLNYAPIFVYVNASEIPDEAISGTNEASYLKQLTDEVLYVQDQLGGITQAEIDGVVTLNDTILPLETERQSKESARLLAETDRLSSETARKSGETARISQESARMTAETVRVNTESARVISESARATSESDRVTTEGARTTNENTRIATENTRVINEGTRTTTESARVTAETGRQSAESARNTNETTRLSSENERVDSEVARKGSENARVSNENARVLSENSRTGAESGRVTAESGRMTAESARVGAESSRVTAEGSRVTAEVNRATFYDGFSAQLADIVTDKIFELTVADFEIGSLSSATSLPAAYENRFRTINFIPTKNYIVKFSGTSINQYSVHRFDENYNRIDSTPWLSDLEYPITGCAYFKILFEREPIDQTIENVMTMYEIKSDSLSIINQKIKDSHKLKGLKWGILGDSISVIGYKGDGLEYPKQISDKYSIVLNNLAVSGSGISEFGGKTDFMCNRVLLLDDDCDFVTVAGGVNDVRNSTVLGVMGDTLTTTFYGALDILCRNLIAKFPETPKAIFTPIKYRANNTKMKPYVNAIKEVAERYAIPVLDNFNQCDLQPDIDVINTAYFFEADGLHPNGAGHTIISRRIDNFINQLV